MEALRLRNPAAIRAIRVVVVVVRRRSLARIDVRLPERGAQSSKNAPPDSQKNIPHVRRRHFPPTNAVARLNAATTEKCTCRNETKTGCVAGKKRPSKYFVYSE